MDLHINGGSMADAPSLQWSGWYFYGRWMMVVFKQSILILGFYIFRFVVTTDYRLISFNYIL